MILTRRIVERDVKVVESLQRAFHDLARWQGDLRFRGTLSRGPEKSRLQQGCLRELGSDACQVAGHGMTFRAPARALEERFAILGKASGLGSKVAVSCIVSAPVSCQLNLQMQI